MVSGPSATRTRTAMNSAASGPFVPLRQEMRRHAFSPRCAMMSFALRRACVGTGRFRRGPTRSVARHPHTRIRRIELLLRDDSHCPEQLLLAETAAKISAYAVARVGEHRAESNARLLETAHLVESDAPLRLELDVVGDIDLGATLLVVGPRRRLPAPEQRARLSRGPPSRWARRAFSLAHDSLGRRRDAGRSGGTRRRRRRRVSRMFAAGKFRSTRTSESFGICGQSSFAYGRSSSYGPSFVATMMCDRSAINVTIAPNAASCGYRSRTTRLRLAAVMFEGIDQAENDAN